MKKDDYCPLESHSRWEARPVPSLDTGNQTLRDTFMSELANQCRREAEGRRLTSFMNNTKWKELCAAFRKLQPKPAWRAHDLLNGNLSEWDSEWFHHVGPDYCTIEWLEIDPAGCNRDSVREVLLEIGSPFEESQQYFRVIGYK